jgi:hypothetical protein
MGDDPMALLGLEGALKHYYYYLLSKQEKMVGDELASWTWNFALSRRL